MTIKTSNVLFNRFGGTSPLMRSGEIDTARVDAWDIFYILDLRIRYIGPAKSQITPEISQIVLMNGAGCVCRPNHWTKQW